MPIPKRKFVYYGLAEKKRLEREVQENANKPKTNDKGKIYRPPNQVKSKR
jgi:hypothetical protein